MKLPVPTEKVAHEQVKRLYRMVGCKVYNLAQGYRPGGRRHATTRQSKGLSDLYVIPPQPSRIGEGFARPWWHEVKRPGGVASVEQLAFQAENRAAGIAVVIGGLEAAVEHLNSIGYRLEKPSAALRCPPQDAPA